MDDWFNMLGARSALTPYQAGEFHEHGFVVLPDVVSAGRLDRLGQAYDTAVAAAVDEDVRAGNTTTRVTDFVNRGSQFDDLYVLPALLEACGNRIGRSFKLSSLQARTLRPHAKAQVLHVDVRRDSADWPRVGFILMVDAFRLDNGATRFVPGSQRWAGSPADVMPDATADHADQVLACGAAGSLLIFDGSAWHGHTANRSEKGRRSLQGAFIPRGGRAGTDFAARMGPETAVRLGPVAQWVLAL